MAEITLGDYTGYIFLEMIKAREMADEYARSVAKRYAEDQVLQYFSVPRFKTPKMELTIPILVSGARFTQTVRFNYPLREFVAAISSRADKVRTSVELQHEGRLGRDGIALQPRASAVSIETLARGFHADLEANKDPLHPDAIVTSWWSRIFRACLGQARLVKFYEESDTTRELLITTTGDVLDLVRGRTVVDQTEIENLLINPETNVVKNGSDQTSVFTVKAELVEEGFYLRSARDEKTQEEHTIVEFD